MNTENLNGIGEGEGRGSRPKVVVSNEMENGARGGEQSPKSSLVNRKSRRLMDRRRKSGESPNECPVCENPDDELMVACDVCEIWHHFRCVGVTQAIENEEWSCQTCVRLANEKIHQKQASRSNRSSKATSASERSSQRAALQQQLEAALEDQRKRADVEKRRNELKAQSVQDEIEAELEGKRLQAELEARRMQREAARLLEKEE